MLSLQGSREASVCKYGIHLLRAALSADFKNEPPWATFLLLYELLDEYALHLIQVRWPSHAVSSRSNRTPGFHKTCDSK